MISLKGMFGSRDERMAKSLEHIVAKINSLEAELEKLSDADLLEKTAEFKNRMSKGESLEAILPEAFAVVREASKRTLKQRHFDVQLVGGIFLHRGNIAEMKTGEGKTLVATLPAYLNALEGKGVHVITVNDYLSRRDATWMGQVFAVLGLSVGVINQDASYIFDVTHKTKESSTDAQKEIQKETESAGFKIVHEYLRPVRRQDAYAADITYGTNSEFGFDYLRDNLEYVATNLRQRDYHYVIVDEIDSILIDEARTPLIIAAPAAESEDLYKTFADIAAKLKPEEDYEIDEKRKQISLTDAGITSAEKMLGIDNIYTEKGIKYVHHLETAVRAKAIFKKEKEYVVKDGEVIIVDEFTGRLQAGRRWSEGLHQAVEAKEGVKVQRENRTAASVTYQNYFRLYKKLSGMTGTAKTSAEEFFKVYGIDTIEVPTHRPIARKDQNDLIFQTEKGKFTAIAKKIKELNVTGQPVLVGTVSIEKNELLSAYLTREGVKHQVLNAKPQYAEREGEIVAAAGTKGAVTIATNMAGRGVDIKLGGPLSTTEQYEEVKSLGGLFVLATERHEARRIDNQLRGRSGRQGDPGETQFFVSLEDNLMRVFASDTVKNMMGRLGIPEDEPIQNYIISRSLETAQTKIEGFNFDSRKSILEYDDVLNFQRKTIYDRRRKLLVGSDEDVRAIFDDILADREVEVVNVIEEKKKALGEESFYRAFRQLLLQTTDLFWIDHLEAMDFTRSSVMLRQYGQRDPLVEYKREGLRLFKEMEEGAKAQVLEMISRIDPAMFNQAHAQPLQANVVELSTDQSPQVSGITSTSPVFSQSTSDNPVLTEDDDSIGRNDPCPCGSGKKFKNCGLKNTQEHQEMMKKK